MTFTTQTGRKRGRSEYRHSVCDPIGLVPESFDTPEDEIKWLRQQVVLHQVGSTVRERRLNNAICDLKKNLCSRDSKITKLEHDKNAYDADNTDLRRELDAVNLSKSRKNIMLATVKSLEVSVEAADVASYEKQQMLKSLSYLDATITSMKVPIDPF